LVSRRFGVNADIRKTAGRVTAGRHCCQQFSPDAALLRETRTIPIVFVSVTDPIGSGFVKSIARPGGNATGFYALDSAMGGKWLEILKEVSPHLARAALIFNPETATFSHYFSDPFEAAARASAVQPILVPVHEVSELETAITPVGNDGNGGLIAMPETFTTQHRDAIIALAAAHRLPAVYPFRFFATGGGLLSYGACKRNRWVPKHRLLYRSYFAGRETGRSSGADAYQA
jgi:putative ABC transport system substrate-binding protein